MIFIRSILKILFLLLLHNHVHAQEKPNTLPNKIPDSLGIQSKDTDGDGVVDDEDKCMNEKGPASNFGCPVAIIDYWHIDPPGSPPVLFNSSSSYLLPASRKAINMVVRMLNDYPELCVNLDGHTDNLGNEEFNRNLCMDRIKVVKSYLLSAGIDESRITYKIYGSKYPVDDNSTKSGRANNRRVDLYLYYKK